VSFSILLADWWDSAPFSGIFLASSFFCSRSESRPAHQRLTQTVETVEKPFASKNREKISHFGLKNAEFLLEKTKNRAIFDNFFPLCPVQFLRMDFFDSLVGCFPSKNKGYYFL
jgi:hypothetical protein